MSSGIITNDFKRALYRAFPQPATIDLIQRLRNKVALYNRIYLNLAGINKDAEWDDHRRIYEACRLKDPRQAKYETERYLDRALKTILLEMRYN